MAQDRQNFIPANAARVNVILVHQILHHCHSSRNYVFLIFVEGHAPLQQWQNPSTLLRKRWQMMQESCKPVLQHEVLAWPRPTVYLPAGTPSYSSSSAWSTCHDVTGDSGPSEEPWVREYMSVTYILIWKIHFDSQNANVGWVLHCFKR